MLSNTLWIMPAATRSNGPDTAVIFYRCGSQQGKPAREVAATLDEEAFTELTVEFVLAQTASYATAKASKQKNATRTLKKYFDTAQITLIDERNGVFTAADVRDLLL